MKYLVTGAAGFIGAHTAQRLILEGHEVVAVDSMTDYYSRELKEFRVASIVTSVGGEVIHVNLENQVEVDRLLDKFNFDSVIHLAAQPGVRIPQNEYSKYISSNLVAFSNVLSATRSRNIPKFLYASSSSVYGNIPDLTFSEHNTKIKPVSFYGATKLSNEILAYSGRQLSRTRSRGLRFFTVYGTWGRPDMAYFRILASLMDGYEFSLYGNGNVLRDFTHIKDVTDSILSLDRQLSNEEEGFADTVNVGGGKPSTLTEMISVLENLSGKKITARLEIADSNDVLRTCADPTYLESLTKQLPSVTLEQGLDDVFRWATKDDIRTRLSRWAKSVV